MSAKAIADSIVADMLASSEQTWTADRRRILTAMAQLRTVLGSEDRRRLMHEVEQWAAVMQICDSPREMALARVPEAVRQIARRCV